jgi:hypothetical protein
MGGHATRQKGDGLSARRRARDNIVARLREGATQIPHGHGNGVLSLQSQNFSTNDPVAKQEHDKRVAEEARLAAEAKKP